MHIDMYVHVKCACECVHIRTILALSADVVRKYMRYRESGGYGMEYGH